eukprot:m.117870 g.117870  ORF g.117870 m.117870 type:complete len:62 (-) comp14262_c0_seq4:91-276(-)
MRGLLEAFIIVISKWIDVGYLGATWEGKYGEAAESLDKHCHLSKLNLKLYTSARIYDLTRM